MVVRVCGCFLHPGRHEIERAAKVGVQAAVMAQGPRPDLDPRQIGDQLHHLPPQQVELPPARRHGDDVEGQLHRLGVDHTDRLGQLAQALAQGAAAVLIGRLRGGEAQRIDQPVAGLSAPVGHGFQEIGGHRARPEGAVDRGDRQNAQRDLAHARGGVIEDIGRRHQIGEADHRHGDARREPQIIGRGPVDLAQKGRAHDDPQRDGDQNAQLIAKQAGDAHHHRAARDGADKTEQRLGADRPGLGRVEHDVDREHRPIRIFQILTEADDQCERGGQIGLGGKDQIPQRRHAQGIIHTAQAEGWSRHRFKSLGTSPGGASV
jgi:hypothetical protein